MTRQFTASRMTVLLSTVVAWLSIGFDDRSLCAEEPKAKTRPAASVSPVVPQVAQVSSESKSGASVVLTDNLRPGRFELKVSPGWTGLIMLSGVSHHEIRPDMRSWYLRSCVSVGLKEGTGDRKSVV